MAGFSHRRRLPFPPSPAPLTGQGGRVRGSLDQHQTKLPESPIVPRTTHFTPHLLDTHLPVDVRTPLEFAEDLLPGAINVPLLSNDERAEIGTLYKQTGPHEARVRGLEA